MGLAMKLTVAVGCLTLSLAWAGTAPAQTKSYEWSDIDCSRSRIVAWPGLQCKVTNIVTSEGNIGSFRRWAAFGTTREGYVHIFLSEAQNNFSYVSADETTAEFLKWIYVNGPAAEQFTPVARYSKVDYSMFVDTKQSQSCAGFRRIGEPRRGGYDWIMGGILCAPPGGRMADGQFAQFIERVKLR